MVKIAVLISGGGTNLQALIDATIANKLNGEIVLVVSNRKSAFGLTRAQNANIKTLVTKDEEELLKALKENEVELIVLAGYLAIIGEKLIENYKNKIINIHPSLIPSFSGPGFYGIHVHEAAFKRGVKVSGATVHFVSKEVDGGPIILQETIDISSCKSSEEIQTLILDNIEHNLLVKAVKLYCDGKLIVENERVNIIWKEH